MRWTRSRDGAYRTTIQVEHRLTEDDLVDVLCSWAARMSDPWEVMDEAMPKALMLKAIREHLGNRGIEIMPYWTEHRDDADEISAWAQGCIHRLTGRPIKARG